MLMERAILDGSRSSLYKSFTDDHLASRDMATLDTPRRVGEKLLAAGPRQLTLQLRL